MPLGYQQRDWEIVDYEQYALTPGFSARGPAPRTMRLGQYFACVGAAQTFGCFCEDPYPALLHQHIGLEALNLGCAGAGPRFFLNEPRLMRHINKARFVIVQVMSGRSEDNSMLESGGLELLRRRSDGAQLSAEVAYRELLEQHDEDTVRRIVAETRANWIGSFTALLQAIQPPKILFWFSQREPDYSERLDHVHRLFGEFPQLVNASMVEAIKPYADEYVECVSTRGMPQLLRSRFTGNPAVIDYTRAGEDQYADSYNSYYPSPEMHVEAADALHDACLRVSQADWANKPGTSKRDAGRVSVALEQTLSRLDNTLFSSLIGASRVLFVGDRKTIDYLRTYFESCPDPSDHQYVCAEEQPAASWAPLVGDRRIVVASGVNEEALFQDVTRAVSERGLHTPVLRLFADVFTNMVCGDDPLHVSSEAARPPRVAYAIVGTPRCGSELLCKALTATGAAGYPEEHLRLESQLLTRYCRFDCARYFRELMSRRKTPNGVFGTKIISHFLFEHASRAPELKRELTRLPYIYVVRRDRIGQAISALLASKTGIWHIRNEADQTNYTRQLAGVTVTDADLQWVRWLNDGFEREDRQLKEFLAKHRLSTITVTYEDLIADPSRQWKTILSFLGIDADLPFSVGLKPTRTALSDEIRAMYMDSKYPHRSSLGVALRSLFAKVRFSAG